MPKRKKKTIPGRKLRDRLLEASESDWRSHRKAMIGNEKYLTNKEKAMRIIDDTRLKGVSKDPKGLKRTRGNTFEYAMDNEQYVKRLNKRGEMLAKIKKEKKIPKDKWEKMIKHVEENSDYGHQSGKPSRRWGKARKYIPGQLGLALLDTISAVIKGEFDDKNVIDIIPILNEAETANKGGKFESERRKIEDPWSPEGRVHNNRSRTPAGMKHRVRLRTFPLERSKQKAETDALITKSIKDANLNREDLAAIRKQLYNEEKERRAEERKVHAAIGRAESGKATRKDLDTIENAEIDIRLREQSEAKSGRDWLDKYQEMILGD